MSHARTIGQFTEAALFFSRFKECDPGAACARSLVAMVLACASIAVVGAPCCAQSTWDSAASRAEWDVNRPEAQPVVGPGPVIVGLPTSYAAEGDRIVVQPSVTVGSQMNATSDEAIYRMLNSQRPSAELSPGSPVFFAQEPVLPQPENVLMPLTELPPPVMQTEPVFEDIIVGTQARMRPKRGHWVWWDECPGQGLGQERLPYSLIDIDPAQPFNNFRIRTQSVSGWRLPDRAEYLWQRTVDRAGPRFGESQTDFQQASLRMEMGSKKFSTAFDIPLRAMNPEKNRNHAGLGDMGLAVKTVLIDGKQWMLTQYFGTYFPTGSASMGLGRGKVALEPGLLIRNRWNDKTWMHGEFKFWFPIAADPQQSGQVVKLAAGFNRVLWETDTAALVPSLEFSNYTVLNGLARDITGTLRPVDGDTMLYITPGMHYAVDRKGDFGLFEIGSGLACAMTNQRFSDTTWTFDVRWCW